MLVPGPVNASQRGDQAAPHTLRGICRIFEDDPGGLKADTSACVIQKYTVTSTCKVQDHRES